MIRTVYDEYSFTWDPEGYHADLYDIAGHYESVGHRFFVAETDHGIVGTAILERFPSAIPGPAGDLVRHEGRFRIGGADCSLERLYVHPTARNQGVGAALLEKVITEAIADERKMLEIWSDKRFEDAHRLYGRFNAKVVADRICHDPDESPEWGLSISF